MAAWAHTHHAPPPSSDGASSSSSVSSARSLSWVVVGFLVRRRRPHQSKSSSSIEIQGIEKPTSRGASDLDRKLPVNEGGFVRRSLLRTRARYVRGLQLHTHINPRSAWTFDRDPHRSRAIQVNQNKPHCHRPSSLFFFDLPAATADAQVLSHVFWWCVGRTSCWAGWLNQIIC